MSSKAVKHGAKELIEAAKRKAVPVLDDALRDDLAELLEYNDTAPHNARVTRADAMAYLQAHGWRGSDGKFDVMIRALFGRPWSKAK